MGQYTYEYMEPGFSVRSLKGHHTSTVTIYSIHVIMLNVSLYHLTNQRCIVG